MEGQPGVVGRAVDLIHVDGQREAARNYFFDRIVFADTLKDATALWEQQPFSAPGGPIFVTRAGEVLDAAGVITGGQAGATGGLLQRRREVLRLEDQSVSLMECLEEGKQLKYTYISISHITRAEYPGQKPSNRKRNALLLSVSFPLRWLLAFDLGSI